VSATTRSEARRRQSGFIITAEFLLVFAIVVIPLAVGFVLLARKAYTLYLAQREYMEMPLSRAVVWDSSSPAKVVGPVMGYDHDEAPLVIFRDDDTKGGVVLSARPMRLSTVGEVYYDDSGCSSNPRVRAYVASMDTGFASGVFVGTASAYPPAGVASQMNGVSWAMGNGQVLYRSTLTPGVSVTSSGSNLFVWRSRDDSPDDVAPSGAVPPCFAVPTGVEVESLVDATVVIDFDAPGNYTFPLRLAFPTPAGTATTPGFGEATP
jgi:hypothetical protein